MFENKNLAVGIFVTTALLLFVGFTIWITGKKGSEPMAYYSILFENDVSGLMLGGPVFYLGVEIGEVEAISIEPGNPVKIRVDIEVLQSAPVNSGTWATLAAQGITGVSVVNLSTDPGEHPPLQRTPGYRYPLIPQRDTGLAAIMSSAPEILNKMEQLLDRASALLDEDTRNSVRATMDNIQSITGSLAAEQAAIGNLPGELKSTLAEIRDLVKEARAVITDSRPDLDTSLANLEAATGHLATVTGQLETWVEHNSRAMDDFVGQGLGEVPGLIEEAHATLREMEKLMASLREDPSRAIYQSPEDAVPVQE